jgi:hypothetical protein
VSEQPKILDTRAASGCRSRPAAGRVGQVAREPAPAAPPAPRRRGSGAVAGSPPACSASRPMAGTLAGLGPRMGSTLALGSGSQRRPEPNPLTRSSTRSWTAPGSRGRFPGGARHGLYACMRSTFAESSGSRASAARSHPLTRSAAAARRLRPFNNVGRLGSAEQFRAEVLALSECLLGREN